MRDIRGSSPVETVPVLIVTASMDNRYLRRAKAEGVKGYLHKPFSAMALKHAVCKVNGSNRSPYRVVAFVTPEKRGASR